MRCTVPRWSSRVAWCAATIVAAAAPVVLAASGAAWGAPAQAARVVVNEVAYDPPPTGSEGSYEWVELLNVGPATATLEGWRLADGRGSDEIPSLALAPGEMVVLAGGDGFAELHPGFAGRVVTLGGSIGNGLGNDGDRVTLLGPDGVAVDGMSYGGDAGVLDPPAPDVDAGHSLERVPAGTDTDAAADWRDQAAPTPGRPAGDAPATDVPAPPPPTVPPGAGVVLNEYLAAPRGVDWDGDGTADTNDEWIELYNAGDVALDVRGWQLDDVADGGSDPFALPDGSVIGPRGFRVVFKRESGLSLNNGGDAVRLLAPDGRTIDETTFAGAKPDVSMARDVDGSGAWTDALPPSPGATNGGTAPAATATGGSPATEAPTPGPGRPTTDPGRPTAAPGTGTPPDATAPPATVVPAPGSGTPPADRPAPAFLPFLLSEVMFDPPASGNDAAFEWVEIHNRSDAAASLAGWSLGDRTAWDALPGAMVPPGGFAVVGATASGLPPGVTGVVLADGRIGGGLANGGDVVRLRGPTGEEADAVGYGGNLDAFDPAVPIGPPGSSIERIPCDVDTDTATDWWPQERPSPGLAGAPPIAPRLRLSEVLAEPRRVDWDGDGTADHRDEWVEIHNAGAAPVDLHGWRLARDAPDGWWFAWPPGPPLPAGGYLVAYRATTDLHLGNDADALALARPDGVVVDRFAWSEGAGDDRSWSRTGDGTWSSDCEVTPGEANRPRPPSPTAEPERTARPEAPQTVSATDARGLPAGRLVRVRGRVTVPPGVLGPRDAYIGDEGWGLRLFLAPKDGVLPEAAEGASVLATGVLADYRGERELVLASTDGLWVDDSIPVAPVTPADLPTGDVGEATEGRLVRLAGRVVAVGSTWMAVDDGTGAARVLRRGPAGERRPPVARGARVVVVGVVGQWASRGGAGGHRLVPRDVEPARPAASGAASRTAPRPPRTPGSPAGRPVVAGAASAAVRGVSARVTPHASRPAPGRMPDAGRAAPAGEVWPRPRCSCACDPWPHARLRL